jgi:transposase-like protein
MKTRRANLSEIESLEIAALYANGASAVFLSNKFSVVRQVITRHVKAYGVPRRRGTPAPVTKRQSVLQDYLNGEKIEVVLVKHGISRHTLYRWIRQDKIPKRTIIVTGAAAFSLA